MVPSPPKNGLSHPVMEFPRSFAHVRRALAVLLCLFLLATFFAGWYAPSAFWASLPVAADPSSILPRLFPGRRNRRLGPPTARLRPLSQPAGQAPVPGPAPDPPHLIGLLNRVDDLASCDLFDGNWVPDDEGPRYPPGSFPFIDEAFDCHGNGRPDSDYVKLRWKPRGCNVPRMDGKGMLELWRGRRLVFVGDSLNRNMWQSLVCMLRESAPNKNRVFEISGRQEFRTEGFYAINYADFDCTIEFVRTPFLVQEWEAPDVAGSQRETLRLDVIHEFSASKYQDADVVVFNTAHWWTHPTTSEGKGFYQEGEHVHSQLSVDDAYRKALTTWGKWIDTNIDPNRTMVFFRGYSVSHYSDGQWNSGGSCDGETVLITDEAYLGNYPEKMSIFESVMGEMSTPVHYLNITKMTDYRKDGHPSAFRWHGAVRQPNDTVQDCSHWCLPGVPDDWNELLYAMLLRDAKRWWGA